MILANIFLGVIVDTFAQLRDKNNIKQEDIETKCYICQITKDKCLKKNINFLKHCNSDHHVWNYIYFITYLNLNNYNDLSVYEKDVWDKLKSQDISWIPINY